jgi:nucleoid-associated protein YgaU
MKDPLQALLDAGAIEATPLAPNSRYRGLEVAQLERAGQDRIAYFQRRVVPPPEHFVVVQEHVVAQGDRMDNLAARYLGDPELYWRLADANGVLRPDELIEEAGRRIAITLPEGVPGSHDA